MAQDGMGHLLAGLMQGMAGGYQRERDYERSLSAEKRRAEQERQQAVEMFRRRTAEGAMSDRVGSAQDISEGVSFLSRPESEQAMVDEFMRGIPAGVEPSLSPTFALAARGRDAAMRLPQTNRELGVRPPTPPRVTGSTKKFDLNTHAARALKIQRDKLGAQGKYGRMKKEMIGAAVDSLDATKRGLGFGPLTDDEVASVENMGMSGN